MISAGRTNEAFGLAARIELAGRTDEAFGLAARERPTSTCTQE